MLQGPFNISLSFGAMLLSAVTLYLSYFDARYTLTGAMAEVETSVQSGGSSAEGERSVSFRYFATPSFILAHSGSRPLVLTGVDLVRSADRETCVLSEEVVEPFSGLATTILEPGSLSPLALEFPLRDIDAVDSGQGFSLEPRSDLWCLRLTLFDHRGQRLEPLLPAFGAETTFSPPTAEDDYPSTELALEVPHGAVTLSRKGRLF
jgi:hypothetical protein